ncbi:hypothetical protein QBC43DRAFT_357960 [Cladorrhinum sp. PSN259]|nr:hypothetical protein QBC43DRAFT_357960 [Cladorrhinum sp. PSN259]
MAKLRLAIRPKDNARNAEKEQSINIEPNAVTEVEEDDQDLVSQIQIPCRIPNSGDIQYVFELINDYFNAGEPLVLGPFLRQVAELVNQRPFNLESDRGFTSTAFHLNRNHTCLLMKNEDVWVPSVMSPSGSGERPRITFQTVYEVGHTILHAEPICHHRSWDTEYPFLISGAFVSYSAPIDSSAASGYSSKIMDPKHLPEQLECALTHDNGCLCSASTYWGAVRSCPCCFTDYAISVVPVPGGPIWKRAIIFTSWKNFGQGHPVEVEVDEYWDSHVDTTNGSWRGRSVPGAVYLDYEGVHILHRFSTNSRYQPEISTGYGMAMAHLNKEHDKCEESK